MKQEFPPKPENPADDPLFLLQRSYEEIRKLRDTNIRQNIRLNMFDDCMMMIKSGKSTGYAMDGEEDFLHLLAKKIEMFKDKKYKDLANEVERKSVYGSKTVDR